MGTGAKMRRVLGAVCGVCVVFGAADAAEEDGVRTEREANRLAGETSPYLLQHQYNPVEWWPWGPEALDEARKTGKLIFLSIGYSTCYWCHVMERESFEDESVAAVMNERFVCIKVDREERSDIDDIYMRAVQLFNNGQGGWPMSVWLTPPGARGEDDPGLEPVFAGTYFPKERGMGRVSFPELCANIDGAWNDQRDAVLEQAARAADAIREQLGAANEPVRVNEQQVGQAIALLIRIYDKQFGGFGGAPKFPQPVYLEFLMAVEPTIEERATREVVRGAIRKTLDRMAMGGMYDQVGGGFHRYSVDQRWIVPHFEKRLYDNGQLAGVYARASLTEYGTEMDRRIAREVCDYALQEMRDESGAFWSAQDAEVNAREGQNYLWRQKQFVEVLGDADAKFAAAVFGLDAGENFRDPHHPEDGLFNVLVLAGDDQVMAGRLGMEEGAYRERLEAVRERLYAARQQRDQPGTDDKVIAGWNGLMMRGLAETALALGEERYLDAAKRCADVIWTRMRGEDGGLLRTMRNGEAKTRAVLEDYALVIQGLLTIEKAANAMGADSGGVLDRARALVSRATELFGATDQPGVYYDTEADQSDLLVRAVSTYDGAIPCGMSVMAMNFVMLHELTGERGWLERSVDTLGAMGSMIRESPVGAVVATRALFHVVTTDANALARLPEPDPVEEREPPVKVMTTTDRIAVGENGATLKVRIEIEEGWHITAATPGVEGLSPFDLRIAGGEGVRAEVDFPEGEQLTIEGIEGALNVYEGALELDVRLTRDGEWSGRPVLVVRYQACTDSACYEPVVVSLDVAIDPG